MTATQLTEVFDSKNKMKVFCKKCVVDDKNAG